MRYELVPKNGEFVSVFNDIPNNAYVYSNSLSSLEMELVRRLDNQFIKLNTSNKLQTANTRFGMLFNNFPNDEIYMIDLRGKYGQLSKTENKADIELCDVSLNLNVKYSIYISDSIAFMTGNSCFNVQSYLQSINDKIEQVFYNVINQMTIDGREMITSGYQLNEITQRIRYDVESIHLKRGLSINIHTLHVQVKNYQEISEFYSRDRKRRIQLEDKIVDRLIDTVFEQYNRKETISNNQMKVLEAYFNNAIIEANDFKPEDFMKTFLTYQKDYSLGELIDNLDQANRRFIQSKTRYLEDK